MDPQSPPTPQPPLTPTPNLNQTVHTSQKTPVIINIITILLLIFIFPIGALMMWFATKWSTIAKLIVTGIGAFFFIIFIILTLIGFTVYRGIQQNAQDAKNRPGYVEPTNGPNLKPADKSLAGQQKGARNYMRQADIETMAKILEDHYGKEQPNLYPALDPSMFASGQIPKDPNGGDYQGIPSQPVSSFNICALLEDVTPNQFCKQSLH